MKIDWKTLAIIFAVAFILENAFFFWSYYITEKQYDDELTCSYEVCAEYPQSLFEDGLCTCYSLDVLGEYQPDKYKIIK